MARVPFLNPSHSIGEMQPWSRVKLCCSTVQRSQLTSRGWQIDLLTGLSCMHLKKKICSNNIGVRRYQGKERQEELGLNRGMARGDGTSLSVSHTFWLASFRRQLARAHSFIRVAHAFNRCKKSLLIRDLWNEHLSLYLSPVINSRWSERSRIH